MSQPVSFCNDYSLQRMPMTQLLFIERLQQAVDLSSEIFDHVVPMGSMITNRAKPEPLLHHALEEAARLGISYEQATDFQTRMSIMRQTLGSMYTLKANGHDDKALTPYALMSVGMMVKEFEHSKKECLQLIEANDGERFRELSKTISSVTTRLNRIEAELEKSTAESITQLNCHYQAHQQELMSLESQLQHLYLHKSVIKNQQTQTTSSIASSNENVKALGLQMMVTQAEEDKNIKTMVSRLSELVDYQKEKMKVETQLQQYQSCSDLFSNIHAIGKLTKRKELLQLGVIGQSAVTIVKNLNALRQATIISPLSLFNPMSAIACASIGVISMILGREESDNSVTILQEQMLKLHKEMRESFFNVFENQKMLANAVSDARVELAFRLGEVHDDVKNQHKIALLKQHGEVKAAFIELESMIELAESAKSDITTLLAKTKCQANKIINLIKVTGKIDGILYSPEINADFLFDDNGLLQHHLEVFRSIQFISENKMVKEWLSKIGIDHADLLNLPYTLNLAASMIKLQKLAGDSLLDDIKATLTSVLSAYLKLITNLRNDVSLYQRILTCYEHGLEKVYTILQHVLHEHQLRGDKLSTEDCINNTANISEMLPTNSPRGILLAQILRDEINDNIYLLYALATLSGRSELLKVVLDLKDAKAIMSMPLLKQGQLQILEIKPPLHERHFHPFPKILKRFYISPTEALTVSVERKKIQFKRHNIADKHEDVVAEIETNSTFLPDCTALAWEHGQDHYIVLFVPKPGGYSIYCFDIKKSAGKWLNDSITLEPASKQKFNKIGVSTHMDDGTPTILAAVRLTKKVLLYRIDPIADKVNSVTIDFSIKDTHPFSYRNLSIAITSAESSCNKIHYAECHVSNVNALASKANRLRLYTIDLVQGAVHERSVSDDWQKQLTSQRQRHGLIELKITPCTVLHKNDCLSIQLKHGRQKLIYTYPMTNMGTLVTGKHTQSLDDTMTHAANNSRGCNLHFLDLYIATTQEVLAPKQPVAELPRSELQRHQPNHWIYSVFSNFTLWQRREPNQITQQSNLRTPTKMVSRLDTHH